MGGKEFFKFNFKKGWIFVLLFILFVFAWIGLGMLQKSGAKESIIRTVMLFIFALPIFVIDIIFGTQGISSIWVIVLFIIEVIYLYLLSCIVYYFLYKKNSSPENRRT